MLAHHASSLAADVFHHRVGEVFDQALGNETANAYVTRKRDKTKERVGDDLRCS
jgi:hypothetical protein